MSVQDFFYSVNQYRKFRKRSSEFYSIVFYSESGQDWHHFEPVISYITKSAHRSVCYVTSDRNDKAFQYDSDRFLPLYCKPGLLQMLFFQFLKADVLVLTMIDLHVFHLKRSIHPVHYIYLFHSLSSTHMVDFANSYDHYDTILCVGPHQISEIRKREAMNNLPAKNLVHHGYSRLDQLIEQYEHYETTISVKNQKTVLLAPTWGENSILPLCGKEVIQSVLNAGIRLIVRPHYQTVRLMPDLLQSLIDEFSSHPLFSLVTAMGDMQSLFESDCLICDWSAMSIEYGLGLAKQVFYIDVPKRIRNPEYEKLGIEPLEISIRHKIGTVIDIKDVSTLGTMIAGSLKDDVVQREKIKKLRSEMVYNIGKSASVGGDAVIALAEKQSQKPLKNIQ